MATLTGTATYSGNVRRIETSDLAHASTFNPLTQVLINNDAFLKERGDVSALLGDGFLPGAGNVAYARDSKGRISTVTHTGAVAATVTIVYDDTNGGRVNYVEAVITSPITTTIRETYSYDSSNRVTVSARTVA